MHHLLSPMHHLLSPMHHLLSPMHDPAAPYSSGGPQLFVKRVVLFAIVMGLDVVDVRSSQIWYLCPF